MLILRPSRHHGVYPPNDNVPAFWKDRKGRQPSSLGSEGLGAMMQRKSGSNALLRERAEAHKGMDKAPVPLTAPAEETAADLSAQAGKAHRAEVKRDLMQITQPGTKVQYFRMDQNEPLAIEAGPSGGPGPGAPGAGAVAVQDRSMVLSPGAAAAVEERPSVWDRLFRGGSRQRSPSPRRSEALAIGGAEPPQSIQATTASQLEMHRQRHEVRRQQAQAAMVATPEAAELEVVEAPRVRGEKPRIQKALPPPPVPVDTGAPVITEVQERRKNRRVGAGPLITELQPPPTETVAGAEVAPWTGTAHSAEPPKAMAPAGTPIADMASSAASALGSAAKFLVKGGVSATDFGLRNVVGPAFKHGISGAVEGTKFAFNDVARPLTGALADVGGQGAEALMEHVFNPLGRSAKKQAKQAALDLKKSLFAEMDANIDTWLDEVKPERRGRRSSTPPASTSTSSSSMLALPDFRPPRETEEAMSKRNRNASPPIRLALGNKEGEGESHHTEGSWLRKSKAQLLEQLDLRPGYHHIMSKFSAEKRAGFLENLDKRQMAQILMRLDGYT